VQLDQVDVVDAEALERAADLVPRLLVAALARLRRKEERVWMALEESPYEAAVSMWLTPCWSSSSSVRSASPCETSDSAAAPKSTLELSWPVLPKAALAITPTPESR
jgi:hypothetical protein